MAELNILRGGGEELRKMNKNRFCACGLSHESAPGPQQSTYSLQDHLEMEAMRNELLESRLALAELMLEVTSLRTPVLQSDGSSFTLINILNPVFM